MESPKFIKNLLKKIVLIYLLILCIFFILNFLLKERSLILDNTFLLYECGFDSVKWSHSKIRIHFFKITVMFIIFDVEIMFFLILFLNRKSLWLTFTVIFFITVTLLLEYKRGSFSWFY